MTTYELNMYNRETIKVLTFEVPVKQRKNGSWFGVVKDIEKPFDAQDTVSKTARQAVGKSYKSVTIICKWARKNLYSSITTEWNEV